MTGDLRYLEKYSVAPAPSRDYYGIRILKDEVQLFLWKISHGPHRTPIVRSTSFADFEGDRLLHEEILRVFGVSVLQYVRDVIAGKTNNSEENSCGLARGWNRVFKEGQSLQQAGKTGQCEKKRCVRGKGRVPLTGVKGTSASTRVGAKAASKTPLEVIKKIPVSKKPIEKSPERPRANRNHSHNVSACARQVTEVSERILRMKVTKTTGGSTTDDDKQKSASTPDESIRTTVEGLKKGLSTVGKNKSTDLAALIREEAKKSNERSSVFDSYFSCLEDIERSTETPPGNYRIEDPWSSNSSIASVKTPEEFSATKDPRKSGRSFLPSKNKSACESLSRRPNSKAGNSGTLNRSTSRPDNTKSFGPSKNSSLGRPTSGLAKAKLLAKKTSEPIASTSDSRRK